MTPKQPEWHKTCGLDGRDAEMSKLCPLTASARIVLPCGRLLQWRSEMAKQTKNTICLWYDGDAEDAARFYAKTFPDSSVGASHRAPGDFPSGKKGNVLFVEFTVMGIPCLGLNGGPAFKHNEAFSFQVATADQAETDQKGTGSLPARRPSRPGPLVPGLCHR